MFAFLVLFQNIILRYLNQVDNIKYWDEFLSILFFAVYLMGALKTGFDVWEQKYIGSVLLVTIVGVTGNLIWGYAYSIGAILRDMVGFLKFPLTFLAFSRFGCTTKMANGISKRIVVLKSIIVIMLLCGFVSLFVDIGMSQTEIRAGIHPFMFLYTHPTYLTTGSISIICVMNALGKMTLTYDIMLAAIVILSMRTKGLAVIAVYIFMKYGSSWIKRNKIFYWAAIGALVVAMSYSKMVVYHGYSNSPRESLYMGSLQLMKMCFPFGSGFGTYASHLSGHYLSKVYNFIHTAGVFQPDGSANATIGDAGFPYYFGQFGVLGCLLLVVLAGLMVTKSIEGIDKNSRLPVMTMWVLVLVTLTTESVLLGNGFELGFLIALISRACKERRNILLKIVYETQCP